MISLCLLTRDKPNLERIIECFKKCIPENTEYEIIIGDNSHNEEYIERNKELTDIWVKIPDKMLFRMGIPWAHNYINSFANSYNIVYVDDDEFIVYLNPNIEKIFEDGIIIPCFRLEDSNYEEVLKYINNMNKISELVLSDGLKRGWCFQCRVYNSRYTHFGGVCHSIFPSEQLPRSDVVGMIIFHGNDMRNVDAKIMERKNAIINEQFTKQNHNKLLASSEIVYGWGKEYGRSKKHQFKDYEEFIDYFGDEVK